MIKREYTLEPKDSSAQKMVYLGLPFSINIGSDLVAEAAQQKLTVCVNGRKFERYFENENDGSALVHIGDLLNLGLNNVEISVGSKRISYNVHTIEPKEENSLATLLSCRLFLAI